MSEKSQTFHNIHASEGQRETTNDLSNSVKQNENNQIRETNLGLREKIAEASDE